MRQHDKEEWGIAEAAALWVIRLKEPDAKRHRTEFERWCAQSQQHQVEFLLARATDFQFEALRNSSPSIRKNLAASPQKLSATVLPFRQAEPFPPRNLAPLHSPAGPRHRSLISGWITAAAALAIVTLGMCWNLGAFASGQEYATAIGQRRTVQLEDGSSVTLNTGSRIAVRFTINERAIDLIKGEALFEVARDHRRPLRVYSANTVVEDISTRFTVRRESDSTKVTVTDGRVRLLTNRQHGDVIGAVLGLPTTELSVGDEAIISEEIGRAPVLLTRKLSTIELDGVVLWIDGYLQFTGGATLSEAVEEFNRYNERKLRIDDPRIADLRIGGRFEATELERFVEALSSALPVRAVHPPVAAPIDQPIQLIGVAP